MNWRLRQHAETDAQFLRRVDEFLKARDGAGGDALASITKTETVIGTLRQGNYSEEFVEGAERLGRFIRANAIGITLTTGAAVFVGAMAFTVWQAITNPSYSAEGVQNVLFTYMGDGALIASLVAVPVIFVTKAVSWVRTQKPSELVSRILGVSSLVSFISAYAEWRFNNSVSGAEDFLWPAIGLFLAAAVAKDVLGPQDPGLVAFISRVLDSAARRGEMEEKKYGGTYR